MDHVSPTARATTLAAFVSANRVRGFVFDIHEIVDFPSGSLQSILRKSGVQHDHWESAVTQPTTTSTKLAQCIASSESLRCGFSEELLSVQVDDSVQQCQFNADGVTAIHALVK
jgi:hypothetical protein